jgi:hypothetical protein
LVNGRAALQLIVSIGSQSGRAGAGPIIEELDLLHGETILAVRGGRALIDESNYVQLRGLHGGKNTIAVTEEGFGARPLVSSVRLLEGSGLCEAGLGPSTLSISGPMTIRVARGSTVHLPVTLVDRGDDARTTHVSIATSSSRVGIGAPLSADVGTAAEHRPRRVVFTLRDVQTGAATVTVTGSSTASKPEAATEVVVLATGGLRPRWSLLVLCCWSR